MYFWALTVCQITVNGSMKIGLLRVPFSKSMYSPPCKVSDSDVLPRSTQCHNLNFFPQNSTLLQEDFLQTAWYVVSQPSRHRRSEWKDIPDLKQPQEPKCYVTLGHTVWIMHFTEVIASFPLPGTSFQIIAINFPFGFMHTPNSIKIACPLIWESFVLLKERSFKPGLTLFWRQRKINRMRA